MNLKLEQAIKQQNIHELKKQIEAKTQNIKDEERRLNYLKNQYIKQKQSELPVLLFQIEDQIPSVEYTNFYENIYYCVDTDEIVYFYEHELDKFLPNTVDLKLFFQHIDIPRKVCNLESCDFSEKVEFAVEVLKDKIDNLLEMYDVNNWEELGTLLSEKTLGNNQAKLTKTDK